MMNPVVLDTLLNVAALLLSCGAAATDISRRRIPNRLTFPAVLFGAGMHLFGGGWSGLASSLSAVLLCGGLFLVFYLAGGMGAGDVKLIAAEASLLGFSRCVPMLFYTSLCGGCMALVLAIMRGQARRTLQNVLHLALHHSRNGIKPHPELNVLNRNTLRLPYAVAIALGCAAAILQPFAWSAL